MIAKSGAGHEAHKGSQDGTQMAAAAPQGEIQLAQPGNPVASPASARAGAVVHIKAPAPGQHIEVVIHPGEKVVLDDLDMTTAYLIPHGNGLLITLAHGNDILLVDFLGLASSEAPPVLEVQGLELPAVVVLSNLVEPTTNPAAVAHEGGAGFFPLALADIGPGVMPFSLDDPFSLGDISTRLDIRPLVNPTDFNTSMPELQFNSGFNKQQITLTTAPIVLNNAPEAGVAVEGSNDTGAGTGNVPANGVPSQDVPTDSDGSTSSPILTIAITDTMPVAMDDLDTLNSGHEVNANVITGVRETTPGVDIQGADQPATVTGVEVGSHSTDDVTMGLNTPITTALGTLTLDANGDYTYVAKPNVSGTDTFTYTIADVDGSTSAATLTIDVNEETPSASSAMGTVNESALPDGSGGGTTTASGTLSFMDADGGTITGLSGGGGSLSKLGNGDLLLTGSFFTLEVNPTTGDYTYTLTGATGTDVPSSLVQVFDYTATDSVGNTASNTITINVTDDAPNANADINTVEQSTMTPITGNVITGVENGVLVSSGTDVPGADDSITVTSITIGSNTFNIAAGGSVTDTTLLGDHITFFSNGSYGYTADGNVGTDVINYTITDADGSTSTSTLTIDVAPLAQKELSGQIITSNAATSSGILLLTFTQEGDPTHSFQEAFKVPSDGQNFSFNSVLNFFQQAGENYVVTVERISGAKIVIDGSTGSPIILDSVDMSGGQIGGGSNKTVQALTGVVEPTQFAPTVTGTLIQQTTNSIDGTSRADNLSNASTTSVEYLFGAGGKDTLDGHLATVTQVLNPGSGTDTVIGGSGNDILVWDHNDSKTFDDFFNGGAGVDTLRVDGNNFTLNLTSLETSDPSHLQGVEIIDLTGAASATAFNVDGTSSDSGANTLTLDPQSVLTEAPTGNTEFPGQTALFVLGDSNDTVNLNPTGGAHFAANGTVASQGETFNVYTAVVSGQTVNVLIEQTVTHVNVV